MKVKFKLISLTLIASAISSEKAVRDQGGGGGCKPADWPFLIREDSGMSSGRNEVGVCLQVYAKRTE